MYRQRSTWPSATAIRTAIARRRVAKDISGGFEYLGSRLPIGPDDNLLFRSENIELKRGERAALLGPNGAGKSTFLKTIMGNLPPLSGKVRVGASVHLGYLAQAHSDLRPEMTVLNAILEKAPRMEIGRARSFPADFLLQATTCPNRSAR